MERKSARNTRIFKLSNFVNHCRKPGPSLSLELNILQEPSMKIICYSAADM